MVYGGFLWAGKYPAVTQDKDETRDMKYNSKGVGPSPPSNHSLKLKSKKDKNITRERGILTFIFCWLFSKEVRLNKLL